MELVLELLLPPAALAAGRLVSPTMLHELSLGHAWGSLLCPLLPQPSLPGNAQPGLQPGQEHCKAVKFPFGCWFSVSFEGGKFQPAWLSLSWPTAHQIQMLGSLPSAPHWGHTWGLSSAWMCHFSIKSHFSSLFPPHPGYEGVGRGAPGAGLG